VRRFYLLVAVIFLICNTHAARAGQSAAAQPTKPWTSEQLQVLNVEEQFRLARLMNDVKALDRLLSDDYAGTNQNGKARTKAEVEDLYKQFKTKSMVTVKSQVIVHGDTAVVSGFQTEVVADSPTPSRCRFTRVYVKQEGRWRLLASEQMATTLQ
jgi:ketosteroid isomerase-like protein